MCKQHSLPGKAGLSPKPAHPVPLWIDHYRQITNVNMLHHSGFSSFFQGFFTGCARSASVSQYPVPYRHSKHQSNRAGTDLLVENVRNKGLKQASPTSLVPAGCHTFLQLLTCPLTSTTHIHFSCANTLVLSR